MQKFLLGLFSSVLNVWRGLRIIHKIIVVSATVVLFAVLVLVSILSIQSDKVPVFTNAVTDLDLLNRISNKLDIENIAYEIDSNNRLLVENKRTAQYARTLLVQEDLVPGDTDPWELFDSERWTQTDFERNVNLRRSITKQVEQHIESLDDIDDAKVTLVLPEDTLFTSDRNPVTASVILKLKPGSDFAQTRKKIEGVERLILFAVEGLKAENLTITNDKGVMLNDFDDYAAFDSLEQTKRELSIRSNYEKEYKERILKMLSDVYSSDRVKIINISMEIDFSTKSQEKTENFPIVIKRDNPDTPYDESETVLTIARSQENISETYSGTGFNPEGPPGVEGQTPPSYKDLDGIVGSWDHKTTKVNNEVNQTKTIEESRPSIARVSASVAIDGVWNRLYDDSGQLKVYPNGGIEREYVPLTRAEVVQAQSLVEAAIGFSEIRGDAVSVENVQFDRSEEFRLEDIALRKQNIIQNLIIYGSISLIGLVLILLLVRFVIHRIELYKVRKEERLAEEFRRMREAQILSMQEEDEGEEETDLQKLTRSVIEVVQKNPEEVSHLIKSWMEV